MIYRPEDLRILIYKSQSHCKIYNDDRYDFTTKLNGDFLIGKRRVGKFHTIMLEYEIDFMKEIIFQQVILYFPNVITSLIIEYYAHFKLIYDS